MDIQQTCELGGFIVIVGGLVYNRAYSQGKSETVEQNMNTKIDQHIADNQRSNQSLEGKFTWLRDWREEHEKDVAQKRLELQKQLSAMEADIKIHHNQYNEILRLLEGMGKILTEKIDKLEASIKEMRT